ALLRLGDDDSEADAASGIDDTGGAAIRLFRIVGGCREDRDELVVEEVEAVHHHLMSTDDEFDVKIGDDFVECSLAKVDAHSAHLVLDLRCQSDHGVGPEQIRR
ncbi:hypothetical protein PMAYCL1PPCAC_08532, partial [Pristionchus mayeri]